MWSTSSTSSTDYRQIIENPIEDYSAQPATIKAGLVGQQALKKGPDLVGFESVHIQEVLFQLLEEVKADPDNVKKIIKDLSQEENSSHSLLIEMLKGDSDTLREKIARVQEIENEWVLIGENQGSDFVPPGYSSSGMMTTLFKTGKTIWNVAETTGKVCYRLYKISGYIGPIIKFGTLAAHSPYLPIITTLLKYTGKYVLGRNLRNH